MTMKAAGYRCWQLFTVRVINGGESVNGCIPLITLPSSLVGKTVRVTIEEVKPCAKDAENRD